MTDTLPAPQVGDRVTLERDFPEGTVSFVVTVTREIAVGEYEGEPEDASSEFRQRLGGSPVRFLKRDIVAVHPAEQPVEAPVVAAEPQDDPQAGSGLISVL